MGERKTSDGERSMSLGERKGPQRHGSGSFAPRSQRVLGPLLCDPPTARSAKAPARCDHGAWPGRRSKTTGCPPPEAREGARRNHETIGGTEARQLRERSADPGAASAEVAGWGCIAAAIRPAPVGHSQRAEPLSTLRITFTRAFDGSLLRALACGCSLR